MSNKERIDKILVDRGLVENGDRAKRVIMAGLVTVEGRKIEKVGTMINCDSEVLLKGKDIPYVSRGGLKLEAALKEFKIDAKDKICLDAGASTGGFTDCLLQSGAKIVYAVDVGYGQLDWKLRNDLRVINIEKVNMRYFNRDKLYEIIKDKYSNYFRDNFGTNISDEEILPCLAVVDVSFISLEKVLLPVYQIVRENAAVIALIKPQFEAKKEDTKKGVVRDQGVIDEVIKKISFFCTNLNFVIKGIIPSPIKGPAGNQEYLIYLKKH